MVPPADENNLEAWEAELQTGIEAIELLEEAAFTARKLSSARNACETINLAINEMNLVVSKAALKVGRLRRSMENVNG